MITAIDHRWQLRCDGCRQAYTYPTGDTEQTARDLANTYGWTRVGGQDWCPICSAAFRDPWDHAAPFDSGNPWGVPY